MTKPARTGTRWVVSSFAQVTWFAGRIRITSPTHTTLLETVNPDILCIINVFAEAKSIDQAASEFPGYDRSEVERAVTELIDAGVLVDAADARGDLDYGWEPSALAFHWKSRTPGFRIERSQTGPASAESGPGANKIVLDRQTPTERRDFADVLRCRHSTRSWPNRLISRETFSSLLGMSGANRLAAYGQTGDGHMSRPYPSGGAIYSLELYPVLGVNAVESIEAGIYRYCPTDHCLETLSRNGSDYGPFLDAAARSAGSDLPPVVLIITSRIADQTRHYGDLAYSLVLKEVGALLQTLYLVCEYLGLAACALGGGSPDTLLARVCSTTGLADPVVGEFVIGAQ
jgi:SagB-type dehydrogenase family enzyme